MYLFKLVKFNLELDNSPGASPNRGNTLSNKGGDPASVRGSMDRHLKLPANDKKAPVIQQDDDDDEDDVQKRASQLKSAYHLKSQDKREPMRVKSLQLLCFKLANHKKKILLMLDKY
jgi:hypothetical protein